MTRYKSPRTLLRAFLDRRISHDEYLKQADQLQENPPKKPSKKRKPK